MKPKKIILIIIDTLRADHLGCYGYKRNASPNIDVLAKESFLFKHAFSPSSLTIPSICSILTSKYPGNHSIGFDPQGKLDPDIDITLASILIKNNYKTAAFVSSKGPGKNTDLNTGFELYDDETGFDQNGRRDCLTTNLQVMKWLEENSDQDFFLFVHYFDVHGPYITQEPYKSEFVNDEFYGEPEYVQNTFDMNPAFDSIPGYQILNPVKNESTNLLDHEKDVRYYKAQYDGCIKHLDDNLGELIKKLKELEIYDDSLIIVTSDHGEAHGENNIFFYHGLTVTLDQIRVPLLLKLHKDKEIKNRLINNPVSTIDIMPTVLSLCDHDYSGIRIEGHSLAKILEDKEDLLLKDRTLVSENEGQFALIQPGRLMELKKKDDPVSSYRPHMPALIDSLNGKKFYWDSGNEYALTIPFDQYQRYKIIADIINKFRKDKKTFKILDAGAGFEKTLKKFLPDDDIYFFDKDYPPELKTKAKFITGDITKVDLKDSYDFVISIDAYEHISPIAREGFINKLIRLSKIATIVAAPFDTPGVHENEIFANEAYKLSHGIEYKWLHEHIQNGLPSLPFTLELIEKSGYDYTVIPNGYLPRWFEMISIYFLTEGMQELSKSMEELYEFYNKNFYSYDNSNPAYRQVIIISKISMNPDFSDIYAINSGLDGNFGLKYEMLQSLIKKINELYRNYKYKELVENREQIKKLDNILEFKETEINELNIVLNSKITELNNIKKSMQESIIWKAMMKYQKFIDFLLPLDTRRRIYYDLIFLSIRTLVNEGWGSLWMRIKEKLYGLIPFKSRIRISQFLFKFKLSKEKNLVRQTKNPNPIFDIIIPVYNNGKYLQDCIESAINQTYKNIKIILIDDCSTDPIVFDILKKYKTNSNIIIDFHNRNKGISETLNDAMIRSSGDYLAFLDCDDLLVPYAIEKVVDFINSNPDKYFMYSDRININHNNEIVEHISFINRGTNAKEELLKGMYTSHLKVINRECFLKVGLFLPKYDSAQDYDLALRISEKFDFGYINDYLYKHRVHGEQTTQKGLIKQENLAKLIKNTAIQRRKIFNGVIRKLTSIVMLTFNRLEDTRKSIESIYRYTKLPFELIILDNNSETNVREYLSWLEKSESNVKVIFENKNLGCAGGRKKAVKNANGDYIVTLDNDICVTPEWLENLIFRIQEDDKIAAACAKVVFPNGNVQYNGGKFKIENDFIKFSLLDSNKDKKDLSTFIECECDWIPGGAMIIKRDFFEKVEHHEDIEGAYEDNDYALQIRNVGGLLVNCPLSEVIHYHLQFGSKILKEKRYLNERYDMEKMMKAFIAFYKYNKLIIKDDDLYNIIKTSNKSDEEIRKLVTNFL